MSFGQVPNIEILDCTIRDGGYINNWQFDKKLVREAYRALSKSGVDFVELGYRGTEKYFDRKKNGLWAFSPEEEIQGVTANINGAKVALMADYGKITPEDFCEAKDSAVRLVRVAAHKDNLEGAIDLLAKIKKKGYRVSLNAMGYSNYTEDDQKHLIDLLKKTGLDYVYVVDSYGSLFPDRIKPIFEPLLDLPNIKIGFHPHNSLQMAFANTLEAIRSGVHIIDCTIYGMGRAAGNLPTEVIISYLENEKKDRYNSIPVLNIIDRYFIALQNENKWGYQLPYMLSGMFQCHPKYAKNLVDFREYTMEDIWKAMDYIRRVEPIGFSKPLLDSLMSKGIIGGPGKTQKRRAPTAPSGTSKTPPEKDIDIPYAGRHKNRDFLILANGPSLKEYKGKIDSFIKKYDPVIVGANYLGNLFKPHYHAFNNKRRFTAYIDTVAIESRLLIGQYISAEMVREYTKKDYENIYYVDTLDSDFAIENGIITTNCRTVGMLLLGIAIVMGAERIFCAGMDGYIGLGKNSFHFYDEKDEKENQEMIAERHHWCQKFLKQIDEYLNVNGKEGLHILTPTSYKFCYKGIENYI